MDPNQTQGKTDQAAQELVQKGNTQMDKAKTVDDRLSNYFGPEPKAEEKQPEPMPSSEKTTEVPPTVDEEKLALENSKNPNRTREYIEKLKKERDEALAKTQPASSPKEYGGSVFDSLFPTPEVPVAPQVPQAPQVNLGNFQSLNSQQVETIKNKFIDEQGNVDINGLNNALYLANKQAQEAKAEITSLKQDIERNSQASQVKDAHEKYPQMDPNNKTFNSKFYDLVRDRLVRNMWEGKKQSLVQIADDVSSIFNIQPTNIKQVEAEAVSKYKETQAARRQGPFESGRGEERQDTASIDELRKMSRMKGARSDYAIGERLKRLGI